MSKLSARTVETAFAPQKGRRELWDDDVKGLVLRITSSGRKTWAVWYRHQGRSRRVTLGVYPALGLADARKLANTMLRDIALGGDPAGTKKDQREADTFRELANEYIERHAKRHKKSWKEDRRALDRDLIPALGNLKAASIKRRDILKVLEGIHERGAAVLANRTLEIVKKCSTGRSSKSY